MEEAERLVVTAKSQLVISGWPRELAHPQSSTEASAS